MSERSAAAYGSAASPATAAGAPPPPSRLALAAFAFYADRYLARHVHAVRLLGEPPRPAAGAGLVVYLNHPSWWDPLVALLLSRRLFPGRCHHGPIDRAALDRYRLFARLGFFGVEPAGAGGARRFLAAAEALLALPGTALWVTPQGRLADARERPPALRPGLARLARRAAEGRVGRPVVFVPLALELTFWEERTPEVLATFGEPLALGGEAPADTVTDGGPPWRRTADERPAEPSAPARGRRLAAVPASASGRAARLDAVLADRLVAAQDRLAAAALARHPAAFRTLLSGRAGVGGVYDRWRALAARWRGMPFRAEHGRR